MKKTAKWILAAAIATAAFVGIYFLYGTLKDRYAPEQFAEVSESTGTGRQESEEETGTAAPDFTVLDENGEAVSLSDYAGKPIVLNFWASWCYYCKVEMPDFDEAYQNHSEIQFMMVNVTDGSQETMESAQNFLAEAGYEFPVFFDTELDAAMTYGATGLPMTVFIDAEGNLVTYARGMLKAEQLEQGIGMISEG